ncbi:MAG: glycoside hydrolase family 2 protein [Lachnospiraceae bacterium]|nr:glycoside hydrolase family 2 protein [Lachnospiraceae bacterium]
MSERVYLNNGWGFGREFDGSMIDGSADIDRLENVRVPHTVKETPLHYFDEKSYQLISGYVRKLDIKREWNGKILLLTFEGVAHSCEVYINGKKAASHKCGYTAFTTDISEYVSYGGENILTVKVNSREDQNIPPFGFVIDYMTYGGIYRDVYLDIKETAYLKDIFVFTKQAERYADENGFLHCKRSELDSVIEVVGAKPGMIIRQSLTDREEKHVLGEYEFDPVEENAEAYKVELRHKTGDVRLWDTDAPKLYCVKTELIENDVVLDERTDRYGYRKAVFRKDGFYLNGKKLKIRGLNRHQSFPYVGYAMPESVQKNDADILKYELGLNAVRTSHYPQSGYFLDRCDEVGLLVFTELPGWQHIGDDDWKKQAVINVKDMILQNRNHASIILWGVRINESVDDDDFYKNTNAMAHKLDPTRPTGGVRCYKKSNLLEDVYTYNDFVHSGNNRGCDKKSSVTSDNEKPYLVSEYMGHMYPTKAFDCEEHRVEHAIRHAKVLNDINSQNDIAGSFGWCMADYNTHKDFGSGDRICYHGVMDMFRNPKLATAVYACQQDDIPVLEVSSSMDIGEHPGGNLNETYIFTNADSVKMYKDDKLLKEYTHRDSKFTHLKNAPIMVDDYIGDRLKESENMSDAQAKDVKAILNEVARVGLYRMSKASYAKAAKLMLKYHMTMDDAVQLYNKYIGNWGGKSTQYRFDAVRNGIVVKSVTRSPMSEVRLRVTADHTALTEKNTYDVACIRIEAVDENGNRLPYYNDPVILDAKGYVELIGPNVISLSGGAGGTYVRTKERKGKGKLTVKTPDGVTQEIEFTVK